MTTPKPKRALSGAALSAHLNKELCTIEEFNAETLRLEEELRQSKRRNNPFYRGVRCLGWAVFTSSLIAIVALIIQPSHIKTALALGFVLGATGTALERDD